MCGLKIGQRVKVRGYGTTSYRTGMNESKEIIYSYTTGAEGIIVDKSKRMGVVQVKFDPPNFGDAWMMQKDLEVIT